MSFRLARTSPPEFLGTVAAWTAGLVALAVVRHGFAGLLEGDWWRWLQALYFLPGWIGLLLPFAAFAGGVAGHSSLSVRDLVWRAASLVAISYLMLAFLAGIASYSEQARWGTDVEAVFPFGPRTPRGLLAHMEAIEADPPDAFSFRASQPLALPPNWLTYLLQSSAAAAAFAMLSALIGFWGAMVTTGLSPPNRRNARWALGLGSGILFFAAVVAGSEWVRSSPENSGLLGAWLPLLVPLTELALLIWVSRARPAPSSDPRIPWGR